MLQAIRAEGSKPPFFVVHGLHGTVSIAHAMGHALDADRPLYALHATGIDGAEPPHRSIEDMVGRYLAKIRAVRPHGPYVVGGVCAGGLVAMDLARELTAQGEQVGPVLLVDPPSVPHSQNPALRNLNPTGDPAVYRRLYVSVEDAFRTFAYEFGYLPFNVNDPAQLQRAIEVGMQMMILFCRYVPPRFDGPTEFIVSAERALAHLHPQGPWQHIVPTPGRMHVIPGNHNDFFYKHLDEVLRMVRFALDAPFKA
ncbi:MAG: thioesterase domain-containing protein [Stellaceae bacterium]